jgi:hypothetical protein
MSECKCSMTISVLGDGCRYCQPQDQIDRLADALAEETAKADHAEKLAKAMQEFVDRVDNGGIRSKYTYSKFKKLLSNYREATE